MKGNISIIIPTYNQPKALETTLYSIVRWTRSVFKIYVIDNSVNGYAKGIAESISSNISVIKTDKNLGWMGSINKGIAESKEEFLLFLNDDVKILDYDYLWLQKLLECFWKDTKVGAVGPVSNMVMWLQHFQSNTESLFHVVPVLSGFCLLTKRSVIRDIGNLDENLSGGDDLDFSLRLRDAGYMLINRRDVFIYHFGSLTGISLYKNHWNSQEYQDKLNAELIKKHGFKKFNKLFHLEDMGREEKYFDWEQDTMLEFCYGRGVDIGCGDRKCREDAIGVDITPKDEVGIAGCQIGRKSKADISVTDTKLPFEDNSFDYLYSRHVLEHIVDDMAALKEWVRVVRPAGCLILAIPNEEVVDGVPLDPTHKHAYTVESLKTKLKFLTNFVVERVIQRDISFVFVCRLLK